MSEHNIQTQTTSPKAKSLFSKNIFGAVAGIIMVTASGLAAAATPTSPAAPTLRQNDYPIVLVHGFFGWGRGEVLGIKHFGGFTDIQEELKDDEGHDTVVTPAMGPISSSWDRACELYAQLMGTTVDYGIAHSLRENHERFGRDYSGNDNDKKIKNLGDGQKVNLLAHSQGTQTSRVLIELLAHGSAEEKAATGSRDLSGLFLGGNQWVNALASLSGANDGSILTHGIYNNLLDYEGIITVIVKVINIAGFGGIYDFKLDHFGLPNRTFWENPLTFMNRMTAELYHRKDSAFYDLSAEGAAEINEWATMEEDVYYYSWSNQTSELQADGTHKWGEGTNAPLSVTTNLMGDYEYSEPGKVSVDSAWWPNDGITSTRSMAAPINRSTDYYIDYDGSPIEPGVWNFMGKLEGNWDHWDMIKLMDGQHDVRPLYFNAANFLTSTYGESASGSIDWMVLLGFGGLLAFRRKKVLPEDFDS